jgi:hypothetical protein
MLTDFVVGGCFGLGKACWASAVGFFAPFGKTAELVPPAAMTGRCPPTPAAPRPQSPRQGTPLPPPSDRGMVLGNNLRPNPRAFSRWLLLYTRHRGHSFSPSPRHPAPQPAGACTHAFRCCACRFHFTGTSSHCRISLRIRFGDSSSGGGHPFNACIRFHPLARQPGKAPVGIQLLARRRAQIQIAQQLASTTAPSPPFNVRLGGQPR